MAARGGAWRRVGLPSAVGKVGFGSPGVSETNGRGGETNGGRFIARFDRVREYKRLI